ncbi:MAG: hypothetical protein WAV54_03830 [Acidimicrobiales bacterium]
MRPVPAVILLIVGVAAIAAGVLYLRQRAHLPLTFILGYAAHVVGKLPKHGYAGISLGAVLGGC